jgi:hypothetical protein
MRAFYQNDIKKNYRQVQELSGRKVYFSRHSPTPQNQSIWIKVFWFIYNLIREFLDVSITNEQLVINLINWFLNVTNIDLIAKK